MPPHICLAIETSNPTADPERVGEVAVASCDDWNGAAPFRILALERLSPSRRHDDALAPAIDRAVRAAGATPRAISRLAISVGPGGFSALRIAVATAKMIAEATGAACIPVPTASVAAWGAPGLSRFAIALASKRDTAWVHLFAREASGGGGGGGAPTSIAAPAIMDAAALAELHARSPFDVLVADAHLPDSIRGWAADANVQVSPLRLRAEALLHASRGLAAVPAESLDVAYPREPEAVRMWRELGRSRHV